jgi:hypothetical protein
MDQACFGIEALENYGYLMEGELLKRKLLEHTDGLLSNGQYVRTIIPYPEQV